MSSLIINSYTVNARNAEVLVSGPKYNEAGKVAIGHVALSIGDFVFEVGRYAGTYQTQFRDASPESMREAAGQVGWTLGDAILLMRDRALYLREEQKLRNVRGYMMNANTKEIMAMLKHIKEQMEGSTNIMKEVSTSTDKKYRYLSSVLRADPKAVAFKLSGSYKLVGNSCVDFVGEALDSAYWIWDFDNMLNLSPSDLSRKLEFNAKYTFSKKTYAYKGAGAKPGWWFDIKEGNKLVLKDGPSIDTTVGELLEME